MFHNSFWPHTTRISFVLRSEQYVFHLQFFCHFFPLSIIMNFPFLAANPWKLLLLRGKLQVSKRDETQKLNLKILTFPLFCLISRKWNALRNFWDFLETVFSDFMKAEKIETIISGQKRFHESIKNVLEFHLSWFSHCMPWMKDWWHQKVTRANTFAAKHFFTNNTKM